MCPWASWLPMPREPECRTTQTVSSSSRQTSTKWLPDPRVPSWSSALREPASGRGRCAGRWSRSQAAAAFDRRSAAASARRPVWPRPMPAGIACSMPDQHRAEVVGQVGGGEVGADGGHAAADVDADAGRDDRALGGDDRADGGAEAEVGVGHQGDVARRRSGSRDVRSACWRVDASRSDAQDQSRSVIFCGAMSASFGLGPPRRCVGPAGHRRERAVVDHRAFRSAHGEPHTPRGQKRPPPAAHPVGRGGPGEPPVGWSENRPLVAHSGMGVGQRCWAQVSWSMRSWSSGCFSR